MVQEGVRGGRKREVEGVSEGEDEREREEASVKDRIARVNGSTSRSRGGGSGDAASHNDTDSDSEEVIEVNATNEMTTTPISSHGVRRVCTDMLTHRPAAGSVWPSGDAHSKDATRPRQSRVAARTGGRIDTIDDNRDNGENDVVEVTKAGDCSHASSRSTLPPTSRAVLRDFRSARGAVTSDVGASQPAERQNQTRENAVELGGRIERLIRTARPDSNAARVTEGDRVVIGNARGASNGQPHARPPARQVSGQPQNFEGVVAEIRGGYRPHPMSDHTFRSLPVIGSLTYRVPDGMQVPGSNAGQQDVNAFVRELQAMGARGQTSRQDRVSGTQ